MFIPLIPSAPDVMLKGRVRGHVRRNGVIVKPHYRRAAKYAAGKHRGQKRGDGKTPYIQHPVSVARILHDEAGVRDDDTIIAALLHDTIEDTDATEAELTDLFGRIVAGVVSEVTNPPDIGANKNQWQIEHAATLSPRARNLKVADKLANLRDIIAAPPNWSEDRKLKYYDHAAAMVEAMIDPDPTLRKLFFEQYKKGRKRISR